MRFGILSTASIGTEHVIPAIQASEHEAAAIASRDGDRAADVAADLGIERSYGSYEDLLADDSLDAVYNPLPNAFHAEWTRKAADAGRHVLCEKPLAADAADAEAVFDHCEDRGVTVMEGFMYRFHPRTERVLEVLDEELGEIRYVDATFSFYLDADYDIRIDPDLAGGALMDVGCYAVNAARTFLGEPNRAYAHLADTRDCGVDTQLAGTLEYDDGVTAHVTGGFDSPENQYYHVLTEDGWLEARTAFNAPKDEQVSITWSRDGEEAYTETFDPASQYRLEVEGFADAVASGRPPRIDREDTLGNMRVIDALYESAERGEPVAIDRP